MTVAKRPALRALICAFAVSTALPLLTSCVASRASTSGPATITSFAATPLTNTPGAPVTLTWVVANAAKLSISDGTKAITDATALSGSSVQVNPSATTTYTLTATGGDGASTSTIGTAPASVTVTIVPLPVIASFSAAPATIANGQSTTLSWNVSNAATLLLESDDAVTGDFQSNQTVTGTTSIQVAPIASTSYKLYASSAAPLAPATTAVTVVTVEQIPKPVINSFTASSLNLVTGGTITLNWSTQNATAVTLLAVDTNHPAGLKTDVTNQTTYSAPLALTTTFTLTAANSAGVTATSASITVKVSSCPPPQIISFAANPVSMGAGNSVSLTAVFNGGLTGDSGTATVDNGVGTLVSGVPVATAALNTSTTFHLSVNNGCGSNNTAAAQVPVGNVAVFAGHSLGAEQDGLGTAAGFGLPFGMAIDSSGNLYVADNTGNTVRMITPAGNVTTIAGVASVAGGGFMDGPLGTGLLNSPQGLAVDTAGNIYVADKGNNAIREIAAGTYALTTIAGSPTAGYLDGTGSNAMFNQPSDVAVDTQGNLYVADKVNSTIRKIAPGGVVSTLAGPGPSVNNLGGTGYSDGAGPAALFNQPTGVILNTDGNLYVTDSGNYAVRQITTSGMVTTVAGVPPSAGLVPTEGSGDGPGLTAGFGVLRAIVNDTSGTIYVSDTTSNTIRRLTYINNGFTVDTIAGQSTVHASSNPSGPLPAALNVIYGMALNPTAGNIYFTINNAIYSAPY